MNIEERIKALLRKTTTNGATEEEANAALDKAEALARKYAIDMAKLDPNVEAETLHITSQSIFSGSRLQFERKYAASVCMSCFNVNAMIQRRYNSTERRMDHHVVFIGTTANIEIAAYVFQFLSREFAKRMSPKVIPYKMREAFASGMCSNVINRLKAQRDLTENQTGLVLLGKEKARRDDYMKEQYPNLKESKERELNAQAFKAFNRGYAEGNSIQLSKGLGNGQRKAARISHE